MQGKGKMKTRQEIVEEVGRNLTNRYTTLMNELRGYIGHAWKSGYWKGLEDAKKDACDYCGRKLQPEELRKFIVNGR